MKVKLVNKEKKELIAESEFSIIPRINEKITYGDVLYIVKDIIHNPEYITINISINDNQDDYDIIY